MKDFWVEVKEAAALVELNKMAANPTAAAQDPVRTFDIAKKALEGADTNAADLAVDAMLKTAGAAVPGSELLVVQAREIKEQAREAGLNKTVADLAAQTPAVEPVLALAKPAATEIPRAEMVQEMKQDTMPTAIKKDVPKPESVLTEIKKDAPAVVDRVQEAAKAFGELMKGKGLEGMLVEATKAGTALVGVTTDALTIPSGVLNGIAKEFSLESAPAAVKQAAEAAAALAADASKGFELKK